MPRPRKTTDTRLSHQVPFRLTVDEYAAFAEQARRAGVKPGELARRLAKRPQGRIIIKTSSHLDPALLKRLDRIAQNLNQLVKNAHIFKRVSPQVEQLCDQIRGIILSAADERNDP